MDRSISRQRAIAHTSEATDYISRLPDVILVYILSFLPLKDCIKISALSKRWKYLWTKTCRLNINEIEIIAKLVRSNFYCTICEDIWTSSTTCCQKHLLKVARRMFADVVDRTLLLHSGCTLDKFRLSFLYDVYDGLTKKVDIWVRYAWASNIKDMELSFFNPGLLEYFDERVPVRVGVDLNLLYELPHNCLVSKILSSLNMNCCKLRASALKVFPSLRRIFLKQVVILDSSVRVLASKFPLLEDLSLENCVISIQFLLYVTNCKPNEIPTFEINISTPRLVLLVCLLVSEERAGLTSLLSGLRHSQNLTLTSWCIQGNFFRNGGPDISDCDPEHYFQSECLPFPCLENSLKKITVIGFAGRKNEVKVVRFLLRNARVLEEISIFYEDAEEYYRGAMGLWRQNGRFHQIFCELLRCHRVSARAEVIFSSLPSEYVNYEGSY
ncbi:hypothetical protein ACJRO7_025247 [Eucalyptus globulus]|uniref:F-box domain-containing protein n=1 Tax=Eucalyptus globulus TaxID=34317 RepID=A0ABD3KB97_EUCGL